ncbi:DNA adenine methylase [Bradyrhizobium sp. WSM3983]|uniref:DNA adenine methylase n=1 Tax=Bradyrhizobium sp. WSM3983 TaxID=1038867 RepID=UPI000484909E|nr:DNA adenine methylase [Bradyrhizobium sp. WSM3983]
MRNVSPLRYPGGKFVMANLLSQIRRINNLGNRQIAEPFAGGAGASLNLLTLEEAPEIHINDADPAIFAFWWSLKHQPLDFAALLSKTRVSMAEWRRQRELYLSRRKVSRLRKGFSAFYLNRCNRSGIIMNGGPIGGIKQRGEWLIDARYNKPDLLERCAKIAEFSDRISVTGIDGIELIKQLDHDKVFFFIDPPYYEKGATLYLNSLDASYHVRIADELRSRPGSAWVLTYDDCPEIRSLYRGWTTIRPFGLRYAASVRRSGKEIMIVPKHLRLPSTQASGAIRW